MAALSAAQEAALSKLKSSPGAKAIPAVVGAKLVALGLAVRAPGEVSCTRGFGSFKAA